MDSIELSDVLTFEWDDGNNQKNWISHQVTTSEAEDVFYDKNRLMLPDIKHSKEGEPRHILMGTTKQARMLFIAFTISQDKVRVISARDMHRKEKILYEKAISAPRVQK